MTIDPNLVINLVITSFEVSGVPTPAEVGARVDEFLVGPLGLLKARREEIVETVLRRLETRIGAAKILENTKGHEEWLPKLNRGAWRYWPRLREYLDTVKGFAPAVLAELDRSTDKTLERLESPARQGRWDRRGLVLG